MQSYQNLLAWQKAMELAVVAYQLAKQFPKEESGALTTHLHRAVVSVPSRIAAGYGRGSKAEYSVSLSDARSALLESETQLLLAVRLNFISQDGCTPFFLLSAQVNRLLSEIQEELE